MKLLDILNEQGPEYKNEFKVSYTVLKDKDFSKGTATYKDEADARKFFNDIVKDEEVISAKLRKFTGPDSSQDMMGGAMKSLGRSEDIENYTHPAWKAAGQGGKKYDELTDQEKNIRYFLSTPSFLSKKKGFTNKDGSDRWWPKMEGLEENKLGKLLGARPYKYVGDPMNGKAILPGPMSTSEKNQLITKARNVGYVAKPNFGGGVTIFVKEAKDAFSGYFSKTSLGRQIMDAEEILDSGMADGVPLDNETEMLVQQELDRLKKLYVDNHGYTGMMASANPNLRKENMKENTSLEGLYSQIQERYGFFGNSEGQTASSIMAEALNEYETAVERAFQKLVNKTNTAINIEKSGGTDTEVRENLAYQFDKIQEKVTTEDYLNATFYNFKNK